MSKLTFKTDAWKVNRGYVQDLEWTGREFVVVDVDKRGEIEDTNYHRYDASGKYLGSVHTERAAGHGSSSGFQYVGDDLRVWVGHKELGAGYFVFGKKGFTKTPQFPNGDITVDPAHDLLCVRTSERFRVYSLSTAKLLHDVTIKNWLKRFQGHLITVTGRGVTLFVHRDLETNGASEIRWFHLVGNTANTLGKKDTSGWFDEAEGAAAIPVGGKLVVHAVGRNGGNNSGRTITAESLGVEVANPNPKDAEQCSGPTAEDEMTIHESSKHWDSHTRGMAKEVDALYPASDWTSTYAHHGEGSAVGAYAIDFMCTKSRGDKIAAYIVKHRKRMGVRYVIWYGRVINWGLDGDGAKWKRYFNADNSNPSKSHKNHVHVSRQPGRKYTPAEGSVKLPVYVVDPLEVDTTLLANAPSGKSDVKRKPGFRITDAVDIDGKWLVTDDGYRYHIDYLVLESELKKRLPASDLKVTPAPAGFKAGRFHTVEKANGHAAADAHSKVVVSVPANTNVEVGSWVGTADGHSWVKDTMGRFWNYRSLEFGTAPKAPVPLPGAKQISIAGKLYDDVETVSLHYVLDSRKSGAFSRHVYYVQVWLNAVKAGRLLADGHWGTKTQAAYDAFRTNVLKYKGDDAKGEPGLTSLRALSDKAGTSFKKIREGK